MVWIKAQYEGFYGDGVSLIVDCRSEPGRKPRRRIKVIIDPLSPLITSLKEKKSCWVNIDPTILDRLASGTGRPIPSLSPEDIFIGENEE